MFYELIYTRCKQGMDILRKGQAISSEGYKVYACSPKIMEDGKLDLQFFANAVQTKQSYNDPDFMDEAYLYYVPDAGSGFLMEFHPVTYDKDAKGNYSHRPGNFMNQVLVGDFSKKYPFELFKNNKIWYAKGEGEAYYYEKAPSELKEHSDDEIIKTASVYTFDNIKTFINEGRGEALVKAVSFLISQYEKNPEERKYLVIKDESSKNIELWIAAIECAFSPKIACSIPFATRMEKFVNANRYTVNQAGIFQLQMNLQDPKQKIRYRAMIVGVDDRDKSNSNIAKPLASSPYVLLDGKEKKVLFGNPKDEELSGTSNEYFDFIKLFNEKLDEFCKFLQISNINTPHKNIFDLYKLYKELLTISSLKNQSIVNVLQRLDKYQITNENTLKKIYNLIENNLEKYLNENIVSAFEIINWLDSVAKKLKDKEAEERLSENICKNFVDILFHKPDNSEAAAFWKQIKTTKFKEKAALIITDIATIRNNSSHLNNPSLSNYFTFLHVYLDCSSVIGAVKQNDFEKIIEFGIQICSKNDNKKSMKEIVNIYSTKNNNKESQDYLLLLSEKRNDLSNFIIDYMITSDETIVKTDKSVIKFCKELEKNSSSSIILVLKRRLNVINKINDYLQFLEMIKKFDCLKEDDIKFIYEEIDKKLRLNDRDSTKLSEYLMENKPNKAHCNISLHICALEVISNKSKKEKLKDIIEKYVKEGFPNLKNDFIYKLIEYIVKLPDDQDDLQYITKIFENDKKEYYLNYILTLFSNISKYLFKCRIVIESASKLKNKDIDNIIIQVMIETKQTEKTLFVLKKNISEDEKTKESGKEKTEKKGKEDDNTEERKIKEGEKQKENDVIKYLNNIIDEVIRKNEENRKPSFLDIFKPKNKEQDQNEKGKNK